MKMKSGFSFEQHKEASQILSDIQNNFSLIADRIHQSYPRNTRKGKVFRVLQNISWDLITLRMELEELLYKDFQENEDWKNVY